MPAPVLPLADLAPLLPVRGALIGLDLGTKTIGVAASDPDRRLAAGVETIARKTFSTDASRSRRAAVIDQHAAAYILQGALDRLRRIGPHSQK